MDKWVKVSFEKPLRETEVDSIDLSMKQPTLGTRMVKDKTFSL